jgi:hypothetical protein
MPRKTDMIAEWNNHAFEIKFSELKEIDPDKLYEYACQCGYVIQNTRKSIWNILHGVTIGMCIECTKERQKQTNIEKYGDKNSAASVAIVKKRKQTMLERFGAKTTLESEELKAKVRKTNMENYGVPCVLSSPIIQAKIKQTVMEIYGVEYVVQNPDVQEKIRQTNMKNYGVPCTLLDPGVQSKIRQTNITRHGTEFTMQNQEVKEKAIQTSLNNYGVTNPMKSEIVQNKVKQTNLERLGVEYPMQNAEVKEKSRQTCIETYGYENPMQNKEVKEKMVQTNMEKYGVPCTLMLPEVQAKIIETNIEKYGTPNPMQNPQIFMKQQKSAYSRKSFIFPSGKEVLVQGYEPYCLKDLISIENISEQDIIVGATAMPRISYEYEDNNHIYFPDIYIISMNKIIEVKSLYTANCESKKIVTKLNACEEQGLNVELRIYDDSGKCIHKFSNATQFLQFILENYDEIEEDKDEEDTTLEILIDCE